MSWLLVEWLVQVSNHDIWMPRNVKEIREDLDRLPIFHLSLGRVCLNLLLRCFKECVRNINLRRPFWNPDLSRSNHRGCRLARDGDTESDRVNAKARLVLPTPSHRLSRCRCN